MRRPIVALAALVLATTAAYPQSTPFQGGPWTAGHSPMYIGNNFSQPVLQDSGPASGGGPGIGLAEQLLVARGSGLQNPPYVNAGSGPLGANWCDYDAPTTSPAGYHYICISPNSNGQQTIAVGAGGGATTAGLTLNVNGQNYTLPFNTAIQGAPVGGDLTGTLPNPTVGLGAITGPKLAVGAVAANLGYAPVNKTGDTMSGGLTLPLFTTANPSPTVTNLYTVQPTDMVAASGGGPYLSFSGLPGHLQGDTERTAFYTIATSKTPPTIEETAQDIEFHNTTGLAYTWVLNQAYPAAAYVHNGSGIYQNTSSCTSGSSGTGPTGTGTAAQLDGTCSWTYVGNSNGDGKSASLMTNVMEVGGGNVWGQAIDTVANSGSMGGSIPGGFMIGQEIDQTVRSKDCASGTPNKCIIANLFINGSVDAGTFKGTAGILFGGQSSANQMHHQAIQILPYFASDVGVNDSSYAAVGFQSNGAHATATYQDNSTSPTALSINGAHSFAGLADSVSQVAIYSGGTHGGATFQDVATSPISHFIQGTHSTASIYDTATTPIAINLSGTYSQFQIKGTGFTVDPTGNLVAATQKLTPVSIASLPTCNTAAKGLLAFVSDTVASAAPAWHGAVTGGGSTAVNSEVSCTGTGWQYE